VSKLPDGKYRLTCRVESPLPKSAISRRRSGWQRHSSWSEGTFFTIAGGIWTCDAGYRRYGAKLLTSNHLQRVIAAIQPHLEPWAPSLPSHVVAPYDCQALLDHLVTLGKLTLAEVLEAHETVDVAEKIEAGLRALCPPEPDPCPYVEEECWDRSCVTHAELHAAEAQAFAGTLVSFAAKAAIAAAEEAAAATAPVWREPAPGELLVGTVIADATGTTWVVIGVRSDDQGYDWRNDRGSLLADAYRQERIIGHVADMVAEGLAALSAGPRAYPYGTWQGTWQATGTDAFDLD
jgi:hypothetical protein